MEFGVTQIPKPHEFRRSKLQRVAAGLTRGAQEEPEKPAGISVFVDGRRLQLDPNHILVKQGDKPARLMFADPDSSQPSDPATTPISFA